MGVAACYYMTLGQWDGEEAVEREWKGSGKEYKKRLGRRSLGNPVVVCTRLFIRAVETSEDVKT